MSTKIQDMSSWGPASGSGGRASTQQLGSGASIFDSRLGRASRAAQDQDGNWVAKPHDIGQRIDQLRFELNVVCEPGDAMRLAFETHSTPFAVVHDMGGPTSRRFLSGVAAAMQTQIRSLTIKRKGYGDTLATIDYLDLPTVDDNGRDSTLLRIFTTAVRNADDRTAKQISEVLMGHSLLTVVMFDSELQPGHLAPSLAGLKGQMARPTWRNRSMLLMPLRAFGTLQAQAASMSGPHKIDIRVAPPVVRPLDAWNHLRGAWNARSRAYAEEGEARTMLLPDPTSASSGVAVARAAARVAERIASGRATAEDLRRHLEGPMASMNTLADQRYESPPTVAEHGFKPSMHSSDVRPHTPDQVARAPAWSQQANQATAAGSLTAPAAPVWPALQGAPKPVAAERTATVHTTTSTSPAVEAFMDQCAQIKGMLHCAVVDLSSREAVSQRGRSASASIGSDGTRLTNALRAAALALQLPANAPGLVPEASITYDQNHLLVRGLPGHERLALVALMSKDDVTPMVVQLKLARLAASLQAVGA
jgi:hypothetical protein